MQIKMRHQLEHFLFKLYMDGCVTVYGRQNHHQEGISVFVLSKAEMSNPSITVVAHEEEKRAINCGSVSLEKVEELDIGVKDACHRIVGQSGRPQSSDFRLCLIRSHELLHIFQHLQVALAA